MDGDAGVSAESKLGKMWAVIKDESPTVAMSTAVVVIAMSYQRVDCPIDLFVSIIAGQLRKAIADLESDDGR